MAIERKHRVGGAGTCLPTVCCLRLAGPRGQIMQWLRYAGIRDTFDLAPVVDLGFCLEGGGVGVCQNILYD
jgi:hypothetical protein